MSTPDELTDYLKVTTPSVWMLLAAIIVLLAGMIVWGIFGRLETKLTYSAYVKDGFLAITLEDSDSEKVKAGMKVEIDGEVLEISEMGEDEDGYTVAIAETGLEDGYYKDIKITIESIRPISFLLD